MLILYNKLRINDEEFPLELYFKPLTNKDYQDYIFVNYNKLLPQQEKLPKTLIFVMIKSRIKLNGLDLIKEQLEKDYLLDIFLKFSLEFYQKTQAKNIKIIIICPKTGYPLYSPQGEEFFNIPRLITRHLLRFKTLENYCSLIHPQWGRKVYPSLILSPISVELIKPIIDDILRIN
ncbi:MAG: hypothetical protein GW795_11625 [Cyanobacteria bacterium]|nr:hypothetical protein [Cyanobacteria bacterium CG_2015-16_32_12]NCO77144.1 hypothetical protein [Cyanobacteria bacterium CG_2015-22_32_23]NCQ05313.1 hypothetical protein [Cyanobacteria bacterium CG_2015-09_32_10]NCQ42501.1 hypothetical protein [Cyanobacteria bacterium CG_2015-04_32_10]NCS85398.1 hypothetical protein [Cyanobacteria bacterium CG_2015-02_32_10]